MSWPQRFPTLAFAILGVIAAPGCGRLGHPWGGGSEGISRSGPDGEVHLTIQSLTHDGQVFLVLAGDGGSGGNLSVGPTQKGQLPTPDGRSIEWSCNSPDGFRGTVSIDGQEFDLTKGALFLVSTNGDKNKIEQLPVDLSKLQGSDVAQTLEALSEGEPKIAEFLKPSRSAE